MTRTQQLVSKRLEGTLAEYLIAFGWSPVGKLWEHPKLKIPVRYTMFDALAQTRAEPTLGWP